MRRGDERGVVVPAQVRAALVLVEPDLALELLVVELDLPAQPGQAREPLWLFVAGQVGEPVVGWRLLAEHCEGLTTSALRLRVGRAPVVQEEVQETLASPASWRRD